MLRDDLNSPAIVRSVDNLAELAGKINAEHSAGDTATRRGLEHFRAAGEMLLKAKEQCGHGKWMSWLAANVKFSQANVNRYMRIARDWDKLIGPTNLEDALRMLSAGDEGDGGDGEQQQTPEPQSPIITPGFFYRCEGQGPHGPCEAELAEHPESPGYWVYSFDYQEAGFVDYMGRGLRQRAFDVAKIIASHGFTPGPHGWQTLPVLPGDIPLAVEFDRLDHQECKGRWAWLAERREKRAAANTTDGKSDGEHGLCPPYDPHSSGPYGEGF